MLTRKEASTENSGGENLNGSKPLNILLDLLQSEATRESKEESENEKERSNNSEEENGNTTVEWKSEALRCRIDSRDLIKYPMVYENLIITKIKNASRFHLNI